MFSRHGCGCRELSRPLVLNPFRRGAGKDRQDTCRRQSPQLDAGEQRRESQSGPTFLAFQHPVVKERDGTGGQCGGGDLKHRMSAGDRRQRLTEKAGSYLVHNHSLELPGH